MTLARLKTATREVWQYYGPRPRWVRRCTKWVPGDGMYLVRRSGKQIIHPGEYLIRDLDDPSNHEWMTEADFLREYELS